MLFCWQGRLDDSGNSGDPEFTKPYHTPVLVLRTSPFLSKCPYFNISELAVNSTGILIQQPTFGFDLFNSESQNMRLFQSSHCKFLVFNPCLGEGGRVQEFELIFFLEAFQHYYKQLPPMPVLQILIRSHYFMEAPTCFPKAFLQGALHSSSQVICLLICH